MDEYETVCKKCCAILCDRRINNKIKGKFFELVLTPTMMYGNEENTRKGNWCGTDADAEVDNGKTGRNSKQYKRFGESFDEGTEETTRLVWTSVISTAVKKTLNCRWVK